MKVFGSSFGVILVGLLASSAAAAPADVNEKRADCVANASIIDKWTENGLSRYRVAFSTTKSDYDLSKACPLFKKGISNCSGINNNIRCYYSNSAKSWVIDNNQVAGVGSNIENCLVHNFITEFTGATGCGTG